jgi:hypothetical protein
MVCEVVGQKEARESHLMLPRMQKSTREWTFTFPSELPFWDLESQWIPKFSEGNCKGQNSMDWRFPYVIGKLLKCRCSNWVRMIHLDTWNTSYGQNKSRKSNWLKIRNLLDFLTCKWSATCRWKALDKSYNFTSNLISIEDFHIKLWVPKVAGVPTLGILRFPLRSLETKCHLDVGLVERHKIYYKGEGGGFSPQV